MHDEPQPLNMIPYNRACQLDICEPDTPYPTGYSDAPVILGSAWDVRWLPCPKTNADILANNGQFLFAWAYNSTGQPKTPSTVAVHPRVLVHRANEITNPRAPFSQSGYSLGDRGDGHAVLLGSAYKSNFDPIQLINAFNGNRTRTLAEVKAQTKHDPYNEDFSY
ncbi:hypothetical protein OC861_003575 [Tilletia horrida]|nr:hypothetical protein OC861_003575 [Tilletia horrida]